MLTLNGFLYCPNNCFPKYQKNFISSTQYRLNNLRGSCKKRQNHSSPKRCIHRGQRLTTPASKSTVAPNAMKIFTSFSKCLYRVIHISCLGEVAHTINTVAPESLTIFTSSLLSCSSFTKLNDGLCAPTTIDLPILRFIFVIACWATPSFPPRMNIRQLSSSR